MNQVRVVLTLAMLLATVSGARVASAQEAHPTAERMLQLSAFGGVSGVYTGLAGGKNFSITAGGDLAFFPFHGVRPVLEVRGTYPTDRGLVDSQKSLLAGLKVAFLANRRIHPYGDFLFGRGEMDYRMGYPFNGYFYNLTTTNVYSGGGGFDYDIGNSLSIKVDGQYQRWGGPTPTPTGTVYATVGTAGVVYRFNFDLRHHKP